MLRSNPQRLQHIRRPSPRRHRAIPVLGHTRPGRRRHQRRPRRNIECPRLIPTRPTRIHQQRPLFVSQRNRRSPCPQRIHKPRQSPGPSPPEPPFPPAAPPVADAAQAKPAHPASHPAAPARPPAKARASTASKRQERAILSGDYSCGNQWQFNGVCFKAGLPSPVPKVNTGFCFPRASMLSQRSHCARQAGDVAGLDTFFQPRVRTKKNARCLP